MFYARYTRHFGILLASLRDLIVVITLVLGITVRKTVATKVFRIHLLVTYVHYLVALSKPSYHNDD